MTHLALDGHKLLYHLDAVEEWLRGGTVYPLYILFSPTSACNHRCVFCAYRYKKNEPIFFERSVFSRLVGEWRETGLKALFFSGDGEPLLHKDCEDMIVETKKADIDVALNTNGRLLTRERAEKIIDSLSWIRISFNAGTEENYARIHGTAKTDFNITVENIKDLVRLKLKRKSGITVGVQYLLLKENHKETAGLVKLMKDLGVDYVAVKPFLKHPLISYSSAIDNLAEVLEGLKALEALSTESFKFVIRKGAFEPDCRRDYSRCLSLPFMAELDAKGDLYTCGPHLGNKDFCYGNVYKASFREIWEGEERKNILKRIESSWDVNNCMPHCRHDAVNRFLWQLKHPPAHVNYI